MKKYVKPEIRYENFALSESIAMACGSSGTGEWIGRGSQDIQRCHVENESLGDAVKVYLEKPNCNVIEMEEYCNTYMNEGAVLIWS